LKKEEKITHNAHQQRYQENHVTAINTQQAAARVIKFRASDFINNEQQSLTFSHENQLIIQLAISALNAEIIDIEESTISVMKLDEVIRQMKQLDVERKNLSLYYNHFHLKLSI